MTAGCVVVPTDSKACVGLFRLPPGSRKTYAHAAHVWLTNVGAVLGRDDTTRVQRGRSCFCVPHASTLSEHGGRYRYGSGSSLNPRVRGSSPWRRTTNIPNRRPG